MPRKESSSITKDHRSSISMVKSSSSSNINNGGGGQKKRIYKGVRMRSWGSWVSEIRAPNQKTRIWLGSYSTPEAAARAYDAALLCLKGYSGDRNFPGDHPSPATTNAVVMSPKSIQRVAAAAAAAADHSSPSAPPTSTETSVVSSASSSLLSSSNGESSSVASMAELAFFDSPKWMDPWLGHCAVFTPEIEFDDVEAGGDILLWSFS